VRALPLAEFATEAAVSEELVERLVGVGAIARLPDDRYDSRDEQVASTAQALIDAGIPFDALAWALTEGRFGLRSLGLIFSEPVARTEQTYADLAAAIGDDAAHLPAVYAALGLPEPRPGDHPRTDEAELVLGFVRLWSLVDPTGAAHIRVARQIGDGTRRIAEGWLDVWDETALPDPTTQGAPTVGPMARPADPTDPDQNPSLRMAELGRRLVWLVHERHVETSLHTRIFGALEGVLIRAGQLPDRQERPPAIAFVDLSGYTSMTLERGDDAAADAAERLRALAETAVRPVGGRIVKVLGDGVLLQFPDAIAAVGATLGLVDGIAGAGDIPPAHGGIAAGRVVVRDGDVFGQTVNLAARIANEAGPGEVVVEEGVVVALPRGSASFEPIGRVELKGFPAPIALWRASRVLESP
jgi:adenylate cyclase